MDLAPLAPSPEAMRHQSKVVTKVGGDWDTGCASLSPATSTSTKIQASKHPNIQASRHQLNKTYLGNLPALAVEGVVVVQADDGGHLGDQRVAVRVAPRRRLGVPSEDSGDAAHERADE